MELIYNWRVILKKAWSLRFIALGFVLTMLEYVVPSLPIPSWVVGLVIACAGLARLVAQKAVDE